MAVIANTGRLPTGLAFHSADAVAALRLEGEPPQGAVRANTVEDIEALVRWAGDKGHAIVPVSSGAGTRRRGDSRTRGDELVLDLSQAKQVLKVGADECVALIEPGVTFDELDQVVKPMGLRAYRPLLPRAGKSVLGACLEREATLCPSEHWDMPDPLASTEIVFGSARRFRTGGAAALGTIDELWAKGHRFLSDLGPGPTSYARVLQGAQGCFGVVAWASVMLQRIPALEHAFFIASDDLDRLGKFASKWCYRRLLGPLFVVSGAQLAAMCGQPVTSRWVVFGALGVPDFFAQERMAYELDYVRADAAELGLQLVEQLGTLHAQQVHQRLFGAGTAAWKETSFGANDEIIVTCQLDQCAQLAALAEQDPQLAGVYVQPQMQGVLCQFELTFRRAASESEAQRNMRLADMARRLVDAGGFISRPYAAWGRVAFERDANIAGLLAATREIFDPRHVLSPNRLCFAQA